MTSSRPDSATRSLSPVFLGFLIVLASCAPAVAQTGPLPMVHPQAQEEPGGTLRVTGQAQVSIPADLVKVNFTVETESPSAQEATSLNAARMEAVAGAVRGAGISGLVLETFGYSLQPEYETGRAVSNRIISGYRVRNNIRITLPDVDATGTIMDLAIDAGANRISSLTFEASDTRAAELEALQKAVAMAREQAEVIAAAMGAQLGMALEVQGGAAAPSPPMPGRAMMAYESAAPTTPIEAGEQLVSATVTITYRILEQVP